MLSKHKHIRKKVCKFSKSKIIFSKKSKKKQTPSILITAGKAYYMYLQLTNPNPFEPSGLYQLRGQYLNEKHVMSFVPQKQIETGGTDSSYEFQAKTSSMDQDTGIQTVTFTHPASQGNLGYQNGQFGLFSIYDTTPITDFQYAYIGQQQFQQWYIMALQSQPVGLDAIQPNNIHFVLSPGQSNMKVSLVAVPNPPIPIPAPQPGPDVNPDIDPTEPYLNPNNYGLYALRSNHTKKYMNYSINDYTLVQSNTPLLWQPKIIQDGQFYLYSPDLTSYLLIDQNETLKLSPNPQTVFIFQVPTVHVDKMKFCIQGKTTKLNIMVIQTKNIGLTPSSSYQQVWQILLQPPVPEPVPNADNFQLNPIKNEYFKEMMPTDDGQYQFYNCGPPVQLHPQEKKKIPLGYQQGQKPKDTLKMLLKPHQYHFSKSILGRIIHIGRKGEHYFMQLFNAGNKKQTIQTGQSCAKGILQDVAEDAVEVV